MILLPIILAGDKSQLMKPRNSILFCSVAAKLQVKRIKEQFHTIPARPLQPHDQGAFSRQALSI